MCGIAGIVHFNGDQVQTSDLKKMTDIIVHRGPDGEGYWINSIGNVGFGHRRLSIIDLSEGGAQPMHYANGRYTITFNGEIYNYIELKEDLVKKGYKFISDSDTEVLLALFDNKRENCLQDLDGMFSFAIWDEKEQQLFCARDRFGEKPFFYYYDSNKFVFGSEMKELWAVGIPKEVNNQFLYNFFEHSMMHDPNDAHGTFFNDIKKLPSAHYLIIKDNKIKETNYWNLNSIEKQELSDTNAIEKFSTLFTNSIKRRLRADVEVGSSLSGGIDSSAVVALINSVTSERGNNNHTFSARFPGFIYDEGKYMEMIVSSSKRIIPHYIYPNIEEIENDFEKVCFHHEEPSTTMSINIQWAVFKEARKNKIPVLLDGQGADEVLAGYPAYVYLYLEKLQEKNSAKYKIEQPLFLENFSNISLAPLETNLLSKAKGVARKILYRKKTIAIKTGQSFFNAAFLQTIKKEQNSYEFNSLNERLKFDLTHHPLENLLKNADRNSMAFSVETRLPFLDHKLVEFVCSLNDSFKLRNGWSKYLLRQATKNILPKEICFRKDKIGYREPFEDWSKSLWYQKKLEDACVFFIEKGVFNKEQKEEIKKKYGFKLVSARELYKNELHH